jgi:hypothetical protein
VNTIRSAVRVDWVAFAVGEPAERARLRRHGRIEFARRAGLDRRGILQPCPQFRPAAARLAPGLAHVLKVVIAEYVLRDEPSTVRGLCARLNRSKGTVGDHLQRLLNRGLVHRPAIGRYYPSVHAWQAWARGGAA